MNDHHRRTASTATLPAGTGRPEPTELERTCVEVQPRLWIGGAFADRPPDLDLVVTLDEAAVALGGDQVAEVRSPFPDSRWLPVDAARLEVALDATGCCAGTVLVRCRHGLNRSGLVAGLLLRGCGWSPDAALQAVRAARPGALGNPYFAALVATWPGDPMAS
jgi:hypothetical protein